MKVCYVAIPFGKKPDLITGDVFNFEPIYHEVIKPAVQEAGLACLRSDELSTGTLIQREILAAILSSDAMIADLTTPNPSVMYELGIRHAVRPGVTLLLSAQSANIPFDLAYSRMIAYKFGSDGEISQDTALSLRAAITSGLVLGLEHARVDSPVQQFFPDLRVELPESLALSSEARRRAAPKRIRKSFSFETKAAPEKQLAEAALVEEEVRSRPDAAPESYINVLKEYRDISAWNDMVRFAHDLPPHIARSPEVRQSLALALNRRSEPGDQDQAVSVIQDLIDETGGDAESYGILGRIYKDRYAASGREEDLTEAIDSYRKGFEKQPSDFYMGVNVVTLLLQRNDEAARKELESILPQVRGAVASRMRDGVVGYWELATALHLALVARQWDEAEILAQDAMTKSPSRWMLETTVREIESLESTLDEQGRARLRSIVELLRPGSRVEEGVHA